MNFINTNINTYLSKKDYLTIVIVIFLSINIGLGLGNFTYVNFFAKAEVSKSANANELNKPEILKVELGVTIEEQEILEQIQNQNDISSPITKSSTLSQPNNSISSKLDRDNFKEIPAPKDETTSKIPTQPISKVKSVSLSKTIPKEINDTIGRKITYNLKQVGINAGYVWDTDITELGQTSPYNSPLTADQVAYFPTQPKHVEQIIPAQDGCPEYPSTIQGQKSWLTFAKYGVQTPIINGSFDDFYNYSSDGQINFNSEIQEDKNAIARGSYESVPVQRLLKAGVVHLPITPSPGQVGNSFIVGHTSNFPQVKSSYNTIFKSFESKSRTGDEFTIWDHKCRQMTFRVFEAFAIGEYNTAIAYQNMGDRRVVTLQGSILDANYQPTKRWLTRGELVQ